MPKLDYFQDSGSNYNFSDKLMPPAVRVSQFDLSYVNTLTAKIGQLIPVWFSYYNPGDHFNVSLDNLIRVVNPPVVPLLSRQRVFFHLFKIDFAQMWTNWESFMRKGWNADLEGIIPLVKVPLAVDGNLNPLLQRGSLADYLGFNLGDYTYGSGDEDYTVELPAMPFLAYQLIYRDYYMNLPIHYEAAVATSSASDLAFFPDSELDLMFQGASIEITTLDSNELAIGGPISNIGLGKLRYRDFAPDYFTSALPYIMKGDLPTLGGFAEIPDDVSIQLNGKDLTVMTNKYVYGTNSSGHPQTTWSLSADTPVLDATIPVTGSTVQSGFVYPLVTSSAGFGDPSGNLKLPGGITAELSVTQIQLKQLWTDTLILEKMTRTDGTYGQFLQTFFGQTPSHWTSHRATYIGGTYQPIVYTEVLQTSPGDTGSLGTVGAKGISSSSGSLGSFSASDYGVAMVLMSIMPDTYYSQGMMREHLYRTQDDFLLPERTVLGPQPVTSGELYFDPRLPANNSKLFGYQSRFDELRYRQNEVHGDVADPNNLSFNPYVQQRRFTQAPNLNPTFLTTDGNIDNSYLTAPDETAFIVQVANRVTASRPLPQYAPPTAIMM